MVSELYVALLSPRQPVLALVFHHFNGPGGLSVDLQIVVKPGSYFFAIRLQKLLNFEIILKTNIKISTFTCAVFSA